MLTSPPCICYLEFCEGKIAPLRLLLMWVQNSDAKDTLEDEAAVRSQGLDLICLSESDTRDQYD